MSYERVNSFEPGFIKRQLDQVQESIAEWPLWMRREQFKPLPDGSAPRCRGRQGHRGKG